MTTRNIEPAPTSLSTVIRPRVRAPTPGRSTGRCRRRRRARRRAGRRRSRARRAERRSRASDQWSSSPHSVPNPATLVTESPELTTRVDRPAPLLRTMPCWAPQRGYHRCSSAGTGLRRRGASARRAQGGGRSRSAV